MLPRRSCSNLGLKKELYRAISVIFHLARPGQVWFAWCRSEGISLPMTLANGPERPSQLSSY